MLGDVFTGENSRIEKILWLSQRLEEIEHAVDRIRYDNEIVTEIPEVLKTLGDAKDAVIAELKTV